MTLLAELSEIVGQNYILTGKDCAPYAHDWMGRYIAEPLAVLRPANAVEISAVLKLANKTGTPVVPIAGNTGLTGATFAQDALLLSVDRMNAIRDVQPNTKIAIVEAGVILANLHTAADEHDLLFPLIFGARGSAMIGGNLSTNAGGVQCFAIRQYSRALSWA